MFSTGVVRPVDRLGRIVIPIELRRTLEIGKLDPLEIYIDGEYIVLKKYEPGCVFCGQVGKTQRFQGKWVCHQCILELNGYEETIK